MAIEARSYQTEAVMSVFTYFAANSGNPVVAMPTGTGKSVVLAMFLQSVYKHYQGQRVMMLTHVKELIQQNYEKLVSLWPGAPVGLYSAGLKKKEFNMPITFAGIGSVAKRAKLFGKIDLVVIDEAHLVSPSEETTYRKFLDDLLTVNPNMKVIGLTATPWRLGQGHITRDGIFTDVCFDITGMVAFNRLIEEGFLCPVIPRATMQVLDTEGVHMRGGEFIASELQAAVNKQEVTAAALREVMELAHDRNHWLVFASGVEHAKNIANMLNDMDISAIAIHSEMGDTARDEAIAGFKSGKYRAAVNNNVLTTGFDFPAIDCIIMLRPTQSTVLWVQMLGRGTRPFPGKLNCLVLDFAGNTKRLGPINDPVIPRKKGEKGGEAPVKLCEPCQTYNHASVTNCVCCGAEFSFKVKIKQTAASDKLIREDSPIVEVFKVDHMVYAGHQKIGRPAMVKVSYYCNLSVFHEYVCIEHEGFPGRKAQQWWRERVPGSAGVQPFPISTIQALELVQHLRPATHLRVWVNKKYPEILAYDFEGTAFGTATAGATPIPPTKTDTRTSVSNEHIEGIPA